MLDFLYLMAVLNHALLHQGQEHKGNNWLPKDSAQPHLCQSKTNSFRTQGFRDLYPAVHRPQGAM